MNYKNETIIKNLLNEIEELEEIEAGFDDYLDNEKYIIVDIEEAGNVVGRELVDEKSINPAKILKVADDYVEALKYMIATEALEYLDNNFEGRWE